MTFKQAVEAAQREANRQGCGVAVYMVASSGPDSHRYGTMAYGSGDHLGTGHAAICFPQPSIKTVHEFPNIGAPNADTSPGGRI
jgi:hypothetical protein